MTTKRILTKKTSKYTSPQTDVFVCELEGAILGLTGDAGGQNPDPGGWNTPQPFPINTL